MIRLDERVTAAVIEQFLNARGASDACPMCGSSSMSISVYDPSGALEDEAPAVRVLHVMENDAHQGYGEFLRVCSRCGFLHYIRDIEVLAFLDGEGENG